MYSPRTILCSFPPMRPSAYGGHNAEVDTVSAWTGRLRDLLRPEPYGDRPSRRAQAVDAALALALTVVALSLAKNGADHPVPMNGDGPFHPVPPPPPGEGPYSGSIYYAPWPLTALTTLPLAFRRRYPLATFWCLLAAAWAARESATWATLLACVIGGFSAMAHSRYRERAVASLGVAAVLAGLAYRHGGPSLPNWTAPFFVLLSAGVLAMVVRSWRRKFAALQQAQEERTRRAVEVERARIAAELHDVVTHNVSVMVIQTGAARKVMDAAPELAKKAMLEVEAGGRAAMSELRHVMGLLSAAEQDEHPDVPGPQPGLDQLGALVDRVRATGTDVSVTVDPPGGPLPPGVDLTAYRVVQEALTNTIKHASGAAAAVTIGHDGDWLEIEVTDTGGRPGDGARLGNGRGLIGLRERLAVYGGTLESGRTAGDGFRVMARVPWRTE
jgi:signal transduction histidine kinase